MSDKDLEQMIDLAGRNEVFARARANGWGYVPPPKWIWRQICIDILREKPRARPLSPTPTQP